MEESEDKVHKVNKYKLSTGRDLIQVGDFIQWECQGMLMFKKPLKVTDFSPCRWFCFVEGSRTGIPVNEVTVCPTESYPTYVRGDNKGRNAKY